MSTSEGADEPSSDQMLPLGIYMDNYGSEIAMLAMLVSQQYW